MTTDTYSTLRTERRLSPNISGTCTPVATTTPTAKESNRNPTHECPQAQQDSQAQLDVLSDRVGKHLKQAIRALEVKAAAATRRFELYGDRNLTPGLKRFKTLPELRQTRGQGKPIPPGEALTLFHSASVPKIDLWSFGRVLVDDFTVWAATDVDLAAALVLALRYEATTSVAITLHNMHRLLAAGMLVHIKATRGAIPKLNQKFALALGMSVSEAFRLETGLLHDLDWRVAVFAHDISRMVGVATLRVAGSRAIGEPSPTRMLSPPPSNGSDPLNASVIELAASP